MTRKSSSGRKTGSKEKDITGTLGPTRELHPSRMPRASVPAMNASAAVTTKEGADHTHATTRFPTSAPARNPHPGSASDEEPNPPQEQVGPHLEPQVEDQNVCKLADDDSLNQHSQTQATCGDFSDSEMTTSITLPQEQLPSATVKSKVTKVAVPLRNPERQNIVSSLEKAVADLERDVMARAGQPSDAGGPSFSTSLHSLAALEAEITAQQRRLASVGIMPQGWADGLGARDQIGQPVAHTANPACDPGTGYPQHACKVTTGSSMELVRETREVSSDAGLRPSMGRDAPQVPFGGALGPQRLQNLPSHNLDPEPSFSHTVSSTAPSRNAGAVEVTADRADSSSPDGNFSAVSIEDRLKRLGLSVRWIQC